MNDNYNFAKLLEKHIGKEFYTVLYGYMTLTSIDNTNLEFTKKSEDKENSIKLLIPSSGKLDPSGQLLLLPSHTDKSWDTWIENNILPRTWEELANSKFVKYQEVFVHRQIPVFSDKRVHRDSVSIDSTFMSINQSAVHDSLQAYLKIVQLINTSYGGLVVKDTILSTLCEIRYNIKTKEFKVIPLIKNSEETNYIKAPTIKFKTPMYADEFLSYPSNVKLLKQYMMIM